MIRRAALYEEPVADETDPFPAAPPTTNATASQMEPLSAAAPQPTPMSTKELTYVRRRPTLPSAGAHEEAPESKPDAARGHERAEAHVTGIEVSFANTTSATLTAADPTSATFQTTSTVRSGDAVKTSEPSETSRQWPRVSESSERSLRSEIAATKAADTRKMPR